MAGGVLALEIGYGVGPGDAFLYLAYELGFVVLPGWLAYRALSHRPGAAVRQLAIGWSLGYVLEILAFMLTAATGTRRLFVAYPLLVASAAAVIIYRRRSGPGSASDSGEPPLPRRFRWSATAVCLVAVAYVALAYFPATPLPGRTTVGSYFPDYAYVLSIAGDAKHHWPIQDPAVAGEPLPYHYFLHIHLAAASQVTGIPLPRVYFRLFILPLVVLLVLELIVAGMTFARKAYVGLIAACLTLLVGQLQLDTSHTVLSRIPFEGVFFTLMVLSATFIFGLVMLVPLLTLLGERVAISRRVGRPREWLLVAILMVGASDAEVLVLPLLLAALLLFGAWKWRADRRVPVRVAFAGALTMLVTGSIYLVQYQGHSSGLVLHPFRLVDDMPAVSLLRHNLMNFLPAFPGKVVLLSVGGVTFGLLGLFAAQLVGLVWLVRREHHDLGPARVWLVSLLTVGLAGLLVFDAPGNNQLYLLFYGLVGGLILSAEGLRLAWVSRPRSVGDPRRILAVALGWLLALAALIAAPSVLHLFSGVHDQADTYLFLYGGLLVGLALLYGVARKSLESARWTAAALVSAALLAVGAIGTPVNLEPALAHPVAAPTQGPRITPGLYAALTWIRGHTPPQSVIAVNNQFVAFVGPFEFEYSAFAERRVFLEGWGYSQRSFDRGYEKVARGLINPFADRLELNDAVFRSGNRSALQTMFTRYGVRYLLVDEVNGYPADMQTLASLDRPVYRTPDAVVLALKW